MGYYDPPEMKWPICPVCGYECETFYFDNDDHICGCENCISIRDSVEYEAERDEDLRDLAEEQRAEARRYDD